MSECLLWYDEAAGEWLAWNTKGEIIARDRDKQAVIRMCAQAGYIAVEVM